MKVNHSKKFGRKKWTIIDLVFTIKFLLKIKKVTIWLSRMSWNHILQIVFIWPFRLRWLTRKSMCKFWRSTRASIQESTGPASSWETMNCKDISENFWIKCPNGHQQAATTSSGRRRLKTPFQIRRYKNKEEKGSCQKVRRLIKEENEAKAI